MPGCNSCLNAYGIRDGCVCSNEDLKAKVAFLQFWSQPTTPCFSDVVLVASDDESDESPANQVTISAHKAILACRSPVFKAMLETEMEERLSGKIKISDVSYNVLLSFVNYLYTAEASLDEQMACDLLVLAEKYQVAHLKYYCEKFLISKLKWEKSLLNFVFAHQHNAKNLLASAQTLITDNMEKVSKQQEYKELVEKDPWLVVNIYEAYLSKQVKTVARHYW